MRHRTSRHRRDERRAPRWQAATLVAVAGALVLTLGGGAADASDVSAVMPADYAATSALTEVGTASTVGADGAPHAGLVLNGPTVGVRGSKGATYVATVKVRTTTPSVGGNLEVTETTSSNSTRHSVPFVLNDTSWQTITMEFDAALSGGTLGANVTLGGAGGTLEVGATTITRVGGCTMTTRSIPQCGTLFGAALGANDDPTSFEQAVGGTLGVRRTYFSSGQISGAVNIAKADKAAGRVSWISFKMPYSWADMKAGKGDAWARDVATKLGAVNGDVWLAFHHEPEKDGAVADWVAIQRRLAPIVHSAAPNVAFSIILMGYHQFYGEAQYSMENMWPGDGLVDVVGFDIYNQYGVTKSGVTNTKVTDLAELYLPQITAFAAKHDVAWGLAETAYTDMAYRDDPDWLARTYAQVDAAGGVAMAYFNTDLNSIASWPLGGGGKRGEYAAVLAGAPTLN